MIWSLTRWLSQLQWRSPKQLAGRRPSRSTRRSNIQVLEVRLLLSGVNPEIYVTPMVAAGNSFDAATPLAATATPHGYTPAQIRHAYGTDSIRFSGGTVSGDGSGTTIAIVDAYDDPNIQNDLHQFNLQFGLPDTILTKVDQSGGNAYPIPNANWITEIALDVEWAHAIAPNAQILLVEANSNSLSDLMTAVDYARHAVGVVAVSMSWGTSEFLGEMMFDSTFTTPAGHGGVTFLASSGDTGAPAIYPAISPNVVSVGGTKLQLDSAGNWTSETGWSGSGGGLSLYEPQPTYQSGVVTQSTTNRTSPDVSYNSDPSTGFPVYDSYNNSSTLPWNQWGGTSAAAPQWSALIAIADQGRLLAGKETLDGASQTLPALYSLPSTDFNDISSGTSTGIPNLSTTPGYDLVTGRGSPLAGLIVPQLVGPTTSIPNIRVISATADGKTTFSLTYAIDNMPPTAPFNLGIYRSDDSAFGNDTLLSTVTISAAADLSLGIHKKSWTIGGGVGQIALPGAGMSEIAQDYYLLAVADPTDAVAETDATSPGVDNITVFSGVYHASRGAVYVQGTANADSVVVSGALNLTVNGVVFPYLASDVTGVVLRSHEGDDMANASSSSIPLIAYGGMGDDTLTGGKGADVLTGGSGNDTLVGGAGNDTYAFSAETSLGSDTIYESGGGVDTLDFSSTTGFGISVNLGLAAAQVVCPNLTLTLGSATTLENVIGGSQSDTLKGNSLANVLTGGSGDDTLIGGAGNDSYAFSADTALGSDTIDESSGGVDTLNFSSTTSVGVSVNLGLATPQVVCPNLTLTLGSATAIENLIGSSQADVLIGNTLANVLTGGSGDDTLIGGTGNDSYAFNTNTALGSDTIVEAASGGVDLLDFSTTTLFGVTVDPSSTAPQTVNTNLTLTLSAGDTIENATGGSLNDALTGNTLANLLNGGAGNDTLMGNDGADTLVGAAGNDTLIGGNGNDGYSFNTNTALGSDTIVEAAGGGVDLLDFSTTTLLGVSVDLSSTIAQTVNVNLTLTLSAGDVIDNATGGSLNDALIGNTLANLLTGGAGSDTLTGNDGNDTLAGGAGNDTMTSGNGDDTYAFNTNTALGSDTIVEAVDGGGDLLDFSSTTLFAIALDLSSTAPQTINTNLTLTLSAGDTIENATGGSLNDLLTGNALANLLIGGAGNDTITGNDGGDTLVGGAGNDTLNGGNGNDTYAFNSNKAVGSDTVVEAVDGGVDLVDFSSTTSQSVTVDLSSTIPQNVNANLTLTLSAGDVIENATGGSLNDLIKGNTLANILSGVSGNDTLVGRAGDDTLIGGAGNDAYIFNADTPLGSDSIDESGGGIDTLDFSSTTGAGISVNLGLGTAQVVCPNLTLTIASAPTVENVIGTSQADVLIGNSLANVLTGGAGNDTYAFNANSPSGSDTINEAGGGIDTLDFSSTTGVGIAINLGLATAQVVSPNFVLTLGSATTIENLIGGAQADTLIGNSLANALTGGSGDDTLIGGAGNDTYAFAGDTSLGSDAIDESGGGVDTLNFTSTSGVGVSVNLGLATTQVVCPNLILTLGSAATIENVIGGSQADSLTGNSLANVLTGGSGDDTLIGGAGNDTYTFKADTSLGSDTIDESGGGVDTLDFSPTTGVTVSVNLALATAQGVCPNLTLTLGSTTTLENVIGGSQSDTLIGNTLANVLTGGAGDDTFVGGAGNDTYAFKADGPLGSDTIDESGGGVDTLNFSSTTSVGVSVNLGLATAQVVCPNLTLTLGSATTVENVIGGSQADTLTGSGVANVLTGGPGNDILIGGAGNDSYAFNTNTALGSDTIVEAADGGVDLLDFSTTTLFGVTVDLSSTAPQTVNTNLTLTLSTGDVIENATGGSLNDLLTGNALANLLNGGAGNDTLIGNDGADTLVGAAGNDTLIGGNGSDGYSFNTNTALGSDTIVEAANGGTDLLDFSSATSLGVTIDLSSASTQTVNANLMLTLSDGNVIEMVLGTSRNDNILGNNLNNVLIAGAGNDTLTSTGGRNLIVGGSGSDILTGSNDEDILISGTFSYHSESTSVINWTAIFALMAEWTRTDADYDTRVANLRTGGGLNGTFLLNSTIVVSDGATIDSLTGGAAQDWFWKFGSDVINDLGIGGIEAVN